MAPAAGGGDEMTYIILFFLVYIVVLIRETEFYEVICVKCGARIIRSSKRKAVEAWNRRMNDGKTD